MKHSGRETLPDKLPENMNMETIVWRYMDNWKFVNLIKQQELYLCRGDRLLQDRFEGTYSRQHMLETDRWTEKLENKGVLKKNMTEKFKKQRQGNRQKFYINSWCMYAHDLDLMWKAYTKTKVGESAVAIQSRVSRLVAICDYEKVTIRDCEKSPKQTQPILSVSTIKYCGLKEGDFINDFPIGFDPFIHKDHHFKLDKEIRIIHWYPNLQDCDPKPEGRFMSVDLSLLIERVVLSSGSTLRDVEAIKNLLKETNLKNIPVELSRHEME